MTIEIREGTIEELLTVHARIKEFEGQLSHQKVADRLANRKCLILVALVDGNLVAYKIGYAVGTEEFYSWLGGVVPNNRKMGIANQLRNVQEKWAVDNGFSRLTVKSMNQFPAMLTLLINSGYAVVGYEDKGTPESSKILFNKLLN